jgi:UV DNA damage endonuclease
MSVSSSPQLGLVCITVSKDIRYRTVTRKRLLEQSDDGQRKVLDDIYRDNLQTLDGALQYCRRNGIRLYRIPSSIFPFLDEDIGRAVMQPLAPALARTGRRATELGLRLVMHPDQFVVLSSDSLAVGAARDPRRQGEPQRCTGRAHPRAARCDPPAPVPGER